MKTTSSSEKVFVQFIRKVLAVSDPTTTLEVGTGKHTGRYLLMAPNEVKTDEYDITELTGELRELAVFMCGCLPRR